MPFLELSQIFRAIALGTLATSVVGCSHTLDLSRFDVSLCEGGKYRVIKGFRAGLGVDYVALQGKDGTTSATATVVEAEGTPCSGATDPGACSAALTSAIAAADGWYRGDFGPNLHFLVTTRGNEVRVYKTLAEVKALLTPIDSPAEAAFLLTETGPHRIQCNYANAHAVSGGFEIVTETGSGCGDDIQRRITFVGSTGATSESDHEVLVEGDPGCVVGRRPEGLREPSARADLGGYFALLAHLEAAAIVAFARLAAELRLHGAPGVLVRAAEAARRDEIRHARTMRALARRFGGSPLPIEVAEVAPRPLLAVAVENAAEGCVREAFGAVVGAFAAEHATDPAVARAMRVIAADEARHAALAYAVDAWARSVLDEEGLAQVEAARAEALAGLGRTAAWSAEVRACTGHPDAAEHHALAGRFARFAA